MKLQNVPLDQIVWNPWRDKDLYPVDPASVHVKELHTSIGDHGFFGGVKGRRVNGKVEIGCGHMRLAAARKAKLESIPIFVDDLSEDEMIWLMADENSTQEGSSPGAVLNEVAAVARRLIEIIVPTEHFSGIPEKWLFDSAKGFDIARGKLLARFADPSKDGGIGSPLIMRYLGRGDEKKCKRGKQQIIDAIATLKQARRYDKIVDEALRKNSPSVSNAKPAKSRAVSTTKPRKPSQRMLDERCASLFKNEHQFDAFRAAVTTQAAQKAIPVEQQYALAKEIMEPRSSGLKTNASYVKSKVHEVVEEYLKKQRAIDKEERDRYFAEQIEAEIDEHLGFAGRHLRSLVGSLMKLEQLSEKLPGHPKIGGFAMKLDDLVNAVKQFSKKIR
jgi:hypothetical protein